MSSKKRGERSAEKPGSQKKTKNDTPSPLSWTESGVQALLPGGEHLIFNGRGVLTVLSGEVDVGGHILSASSQPLELCADDSSAIMILAVSAEARPPLAGSGGAVFTLERSSDVGVDGTLANNSAEVVGNQLLGFSVHLPGDASQTPIHCFQTPPVWQDCASQLAASLHAGLAVGAPPAVIAICGSKKVGKSAFGRYLVNSLLNSCPMVAYLDTDCGQPEFTPPGLVSLTLLSAPIVGAPHLHQRTPERAYFQGDVSPATDPTRYVQSIRSLFDWLLHKVSNDSGNDPMPPIIVNSHGWVKGFGFDVLVDVLHALPITHFVHLGAANPRRNLPQGVFWDPPENAPLPLLFEIPGVQHAHIDANNNNINVSSDGQQPGSPDDGLGQPRSGPVAAEQRAMQWVAFAEACITSSAETSIKEGNIDIETETLSNAGVQQNAGEVGDRLAAAIPFEVSLEDIDVSILHSAVPASEVPRALNGAIVGLCACSTTPSGPSPCLGLGIVRAVNAVAGKAYILTSLSEDRLQLVESLELGKLELPPGLLQTKNYLSPYLAMHSLAASGTGAGAIKSRNNLMRAGQMGG